MSTRIAMSTTEITAQTLLARPKRADARRNYEKVLAAAREAFAEGGESTALEEIARRAGSGSARSTATSRIARRCSRRSTSTRSRRSAARPRELEDGDPWEALNALVRALHRLHRHQAGARRRAPQLPRPRRAALQGLPRGAVGAGEPLLKRAQEAGVVRPDVDIGDVIQMVIGIAKIPAADPEQTEHILRIALDGLRYRPDAA